MRLGRLAAADVTRALRGIRARRRASTEPIYLTTFLFQLHLLPLYSPSMTSTNAHTLFCNLTHSLQPHTLFITCTLFTTCSIFTIYTLFATYTPFTNHTLLTTYTLF